MRAFNRILKKFDDFPLWLAGFILLTIVFAPYLIMGEKSVFPIHDQLDETFLSYVLNARHLFDGAKYFDEIMCGLNKSGLQPAAPFFVLLYCFFSPFWAFVIQYAIVFCVAFFGMYGCMKEFTGSSILAVAISGCFAMLPYQPIYGTSITGVPMVMAAVLALKKGQRIWFSYLSILFFAFTSHVVLIGWVVLGYWILYLIYSGIRRKLNRHVAGGFFLLLGGYLVTNFSLFLDIFMDNSFVSHREEFVHGYTDFGQTVRDVFVDGVGLHAVSLHRRLILPILIGILVGALAFRVLSKESKKLYGYAVIGMVVLLGTALAYGFFNSYIFTSWQNQQTRILRYFAFERVIWVYPAAWLIEAGLVLGVWWHAFDDSENDRFFHWGKQHAYLIHILILVIFICPTASSILRESYFHMSISQYINGSSITGYITWEDYFAEDLMDTLEEALGDPTQYRIVHLGIYPAPALLHGFYTVDGYSNNYPLEYKHEFRKVIEGELLKIEENRIYFDTWGSRCYLFNHVTGNYTLLKKGNSVKYEDLEFDMDVLKEMECRYIFSGAEITDASRMGLKSLGYYETDSSYWGIWLYEIL